MGRKRLENARRNTVAVRFNDDELAVICKAADRDGGENADVSPWVRDAAVVKAKSKVAKPAPKRTADRE
jgi:hypothetical protein